MAQFQLSDAINSKKVFLIRWSEIRDRTDPIYFNSVNDLDIVNSSSYPVKRLGEVITMKRGRFSHRPRNDPKFYNGSYPFIQTGDIVKASKTNGKIQYSQTLNELGLKTSRLFEPDVLVMTIAANIGDTAILDFPACFPDSLIAIKPKTKDLSLYYLNVYFKYLKKYLDNLAPQAAQKNINYQQLLPTPIVIPPLEVQNRIVELYKMTQIRKTKKEQEARALFDSINAYLLEELGIVLPRHDNSLRNRIFISNYSDISSKRFDPSGITLHKFRIEGGKYRNVSLRSIATISKGQSIVKENTIEGEYPVIAGGQTSPYNHNQFNYDGNVITISASGAYAGYVWYHKTPIFASDCSVVFSKDESKVMTIFIAEILKLKQKEIYSLQQGAGQPHVYFKDLARLKIPLPDEYDKQKEMVSHINAIRAKVYELQIDAFKIEEEARKEIERIIIN